MNHTNSLFKEILKQVEVIDFRAFANDDRANDIRLTNKHYQVGAIDTLLSIADKNDFSLCRGNGFIYVYNGEFWNVVDQDYFKNFLAKSAFKMGVNRIDAKHYLFQEQLLKQFHASANPLNPNRNKETVLINLKNGTYEITCKERKLREFRKGDFLTYQLPFDFDTSATAPLFENYLNKVLPERKLQNVLSEFLGYVFIRSLKLEKCLLLYGSGANGKSVFFEISNALLGKANVSNFSLSNLSEEHNRALIVDKLLNYGSEIRGNIESDIFKQLVSDESVQCRLKYGNSFTIEDYARLCFNCNELPKEVEHTEAFFRRFLIIPFDVTIPENERNPDLAKNIIDNELSGVFNWELEGVNRLLNQRKFTECDTIRNSIKEYKEQSDSVHLFLSEEGYKKSNEVFTLLKHAYPDYRTFCSSDGYRPLSKSNFKRRLESLGYLVERKNIGVCAFLAKER